MLARTVEYAVRATIVLARNYGRRSVSADEIASMVGAPRNYLSKTLNALARQGILTSARGPGGGFALAVSPDLLTVSDIAAVFADARTRIERCVLRDATCDPQHPCSAHPLWAKITRRAGNSLRTTIAQLSGESMDEAGHRPAVSRLTVQADRNTPKTGTYHEDDSIT